MFGLAVVAGAHQPTGAKVVRPLATMEIPALATMESGRFAWASLAAAAEKAWWWQPLLPLVVCRRLRVARAAASVVKEAGEEEEQGMD